MNLTWAHSRLVIFSPTPSLFWYSRTWHLVIPFSQPAVYPRTGNPQTHSKFKSKNVLEASCTLTVQGSICQRRNLLCSTSSQGISWGRRSLDQTKKSKITYDIYTFCLLMYIFFNLSIFFPLSFLGSAHF